MGSRRSPSHQIQIDREGAIVRIALVRGDTIPNKDLILRYQVAGKSTQTAVLAQADSRGGHFALYLIPALNYWQQPGCGIRGNSKQSPRRLTGRAF